MRYEVTTIKKEDNKFAVEIKGGTVTKHTVTVDEKYMKKLGYEDAEQLVRDSIDFLLRREPNTAILKEFSLQTIEEYFPEYKKEIKQ